MSPALAALLCVGALYFTFFLAYKLLHWDIGVGLGVLSGILFVGSFSGFLLGGSAWGIVAVLSLVTSAGLLMGADHWRREHNLSLAGEPLSGILRSPDCSTEYETWPHRLSRWGFPSAWEMHVRKLAREREARRRAQS